ncbi:hypothetical protein OIU78_001208 [Salix suchowensis]|nr:hypothetical protein OIU78_001208 [Salix suchowensis]
MVSRHWSKKATKESKPVQGKMLGQVHDLTLPSWHLYILSSTYLLKEKLTDEAIIECTNSSPVLLFSIAV